MDSELDIAMSKAKIGILNTANKFIGSIVFDLNHVWDDTISTANVNGVEVKYNPEFFMELRPQERVFLILHEAWHVAFQHITAEGSKRIGNRNPGIFYKAGDYVINLMLVESGCTMPTITEKLIKLFPDIPKEKIGEALGLIDTKFSGLSTEEVYELIKDDPDDQHQSPMDGDVQPGERGEGQDSEAASEALQAKVTASLVKAMAKSKLAGEEAGVVPGDIRRLVDKLINPKLPWGQLLRRFLNDANQEDYSWKKINRRFFPEYILPSLHSEALGHIVVAMDTSGSLSKKEITAITSEIKYIHKHFQPEKLTILSADYEINNIHIVNPRDKIETLSFQGGGGTLFDPVFKYCDTNPPIALIYFTDLYAPPITKKPKYPVLWVCTSKASKAEIGQTIYLDVD